MAQHVATVIATLFLQMHGHGANGAMALLLNISMCICSGSPGGAQYDEKNIRRRVYDALNVLMAMDIIQKEKKDIQWKGLPSGHSHALERLQAEKQRLLVAIDKAQQTVQVQYASLGKLTV